jgi:tetratricopeptide (TPR) repeat protein/transcriptional regulator with XRE-family HTH domain
MSDDAGSLGSRLRAYRRAAGLSQPELAERSGLSVRAISDLERDRTRWPYPNSLTRLADALELGGDARADLIGSAGRRLGQAADGGTPGRRAASTGVTGDRRRAERGRLVPHGLPAAVPAFVGRQAELDSLSRVLHQPGGTAVVTAIGGTAGVGKTALAVHWAHQVAAEFPDGQLFVNLRGFDPSEAPLTPADAARALLDALQVPADQLPGTVEGQLSLYRSLLAGKRMLVVLDNAHDAAQVRPLLPGYPTCRAVVTSRNQLTSLAAIEAARPLALDVLTAGEARQLLRHRLGDSRLAADPDAATQIITSCARLPLALCTVAARAAVHPDLPLAQVAAGLLTPSSLDAFTDGGDPAADVRTVLSWSYQQLDPDSARAFRLAGLHPGPDLERYALAALTGTTADEAGHLLDLLARVCLVQDTGPGRYGMHDLLRGYARELAAADGEQERRAAVTGLLDYYLCTAAAAMDVTVPSEQQRRPRIAAPSVPLPVFGDETAAQAWLDAERANLVAVSTYAARQDWPRHAIQLSATLARYLDTGAHFRQAIVMHDHAREAALGTGDRAAEAEAVVRLGSVDLRQGRFQQATGRFREALDLPSEAGSEPMRARLYSNLGLVTLLQGDIDQAVGYFQQSLSLHRETGDRAGEARALGNLGFADLRRGRYPQATGHLQESLALCRDILDRGGEARALANLGEVDLRQGNYQQAAGHLQQALELAHAAGDLISEADTRASLGTIDLQLGFHEQAASHWPSSGKPAT